MIERRRPEDVPKFKLMDIMPKLSDYTATFALMAIPAVAFTAMAMLVRNSTYGIQTTVYVTYAQDCGAHRDQDRASIRGH